ncbi:unnamed protein product [Phaeothamnion confervicola]
MERLVRRGRLALDSEYRFGFGEPCMLGKSFKADAGKAGAQQRTSAPWGLICMDMYGPVAPPARGGFPYVLQLVDDGTCMLAVYMLRHKDEVPEAVKRFIIEWVRPRGCQIQRLRGDDAAEFKGSGMQYVTPRPFGGIQLEYSTPYCHWQIGVVERGWRTLADKTRAVMAAAGLPPQYWAFTMTYVCWLTNHLPTRVALPGCAVTPLQALEPDTAPLDLLTLHPSSCPIYVHVNDETGRTALQA